MTGKPSKPPKVTTSYAGPALFGVAVIVLTFGVAGGWAAVAPLDSAVVAPGVVAVENNRRSVQHLEGGIISEILVKDGQRVEEGDILFRLDTTRALASETVERQQFYTALILEARLLSERDKLEEIKFPDEILALGDDPIIARAIRDQTSQFQERRASIDGQIEILQSRVSQTESRIDGLERELESTREQIGYINDELEGVRALYKKGLVSNQRLLSLERERSRLQGTIGRTIAEISGAQTLIGEAELQIRQLRQEHQEKAAEQITEVRKIINELTEKMTVSSDILQRTAIIAPRSGAIINLKVFTVGQVIRAGDTLLEIVPADEGLIVSAQISPIDVDRISVGMRAEVRFPSFKANKTPVAYGRISEVSADRLIDENTRQPYFLARVAVSDTDIPEVLQGKLMPGMPGDVIFTTGERTVLQYLIHPIETALSQALTEE